MTKQCTNCKYCKKTYIGGNEWYLLCRISNEQVNNNPSCNRYEEKEYLFEMDTMGGVTDESYRFDKRIKRGRL